MLSHYLHSKRCCYEIQALTLVLLRNIFVFHWCCSWIQINGPEGRPNNLPQPAWQLAELFFWSDLSWLQADLCADSYVTSTHFSLLGMATLRMRYISYVGIEHIIHNQIIHNMLFVELGPTSFQVSCNCTYFSIFEYHVLIASILFDNSFHGVFFIKIRLCYQIVLRPQFFPLFPWVYDNICHGLHHIHL